MSTTCIHCGGWTGLVTDFEPKHREGCPLREEPPVSAERRFMSSFIADGTAEDCPVKR